jgi:hypothetical protein
MIFGSGTHRLPLGIHHDYPIETLTRVAEYYHGSDLPILAKDGAVLQTAGAVSRLCWWAKAVASVRVATPSLVRMRETCTPAVLTRMNSSAASCRLLMPVANFYYERFHDAAMFAPQPKGTVPTGVAVFTHRRLRNPPLRGKSAQHHPLVGVLLRRPLPGPRGPRPAGRRHPRILPFPHPLTGRDPAFLDR